MGILGSLIFFLTFACAKENKPHAPTPNEGLKNEYTLRVASAKFDFDQETGWPAREDCDGTLWAGLANAAGVSSVKIELAEHFPGEIHRRPFKPCWTPEDGDIGSQTTVSRDMLQGYMYALWRQRNLAAFERLAKYGESHGWKMGEPLADGRVLLSGNGVGTLGRAVHRLGGPAKVYRHTPYFYASSGPDYAKHLTALGIALNGEIDGAITDQAKDVLKSLYEENQKDALFCSLHKLYTDGCTDVCADLLLGDYQYPSYVRGDPNYLTTHWLFVAKILLGGETCQ